MYNGTINAHLFKDMSYSIQVNLTDNASNTNTTGAAPINISVDTRPDISQGTPINGTDTTVVEQVFVCNGTDRTNLNGTTFFIYHSNGTLAHQNSSNFTGINGVTTGSAIAGGLSNLTNFSYTLPERGTYYWTCNGTDTKGNSNMVQKLNSHSH